MENKSKVSKFQFRGYRIEESFIKIKVEEPGDEYSIEIKPKGKVTKSESNFELQLDIRIENEDKTLEINVIAVSEFFFQDIEDEKLDAYLFLNAPALLFPYLRAYISTLSTLSGVSPITLPTLNLVGLRPDVKRNTEFID